MLEEENLEETETCDKMPENLFRNRLLSRIDEDSVKFPRRRSSANSNENSKSGSFETYAEFYLKTKRSGSLAVPFNNYSNKQQNELEKVFDLLDLDNDGFLNKNDIKTVYKTIDPSLENRLNIDELIKDVTSEESTKISYQQFGDYYGGTYFGRFNKYELRYVFDLFDKDKDGLIGHDDLRLMFDPVGWNDKVDVEKVHNSMDYNRDGRVCFEDFKMSMSNFKSTTTNFFSF